MTEKEIKSRVKELIADMSLKEKIGQLCYCNGERPEELEFIEENLIGTVSNLSGSELSTELQERVIKASPHNIPPLLMSDVISGYRTIFPLPVAEACSFDMDMIKKDSECIGKESEAAGVSWTCAPMVDIARDPRWGRISEGAGEDPYLGSCVAKARVEGLGNAPGIASCAKHFVAYGNCEGGRDYDSALVNEVELRNVYLRPFKAAAEAGVHSVMASFNDTLGIPMHCNKYLITDVLRNEFKLDGVLASDYNAIVELINHGVAADPMEATYKAFKAGMDLDTGSNVYKEYLEKLVEEGKVTEDEIDIYVERILTLKFRIGLFDKHTYPKETEEKLTLCDEFRKQARYAVSKSTVLLKNDGDLLPLTKDDNLLVIGPMADDSDAPLGWWRCKGKTEDVTTLLTAIKGRTDKVNYVCGGNTLEGEDIDKEALIKAAKDCDKIIAIVGEPSYISGEAHTRGDITLPGTQTELIEFAGTLGKPLCMVLITGRPLVITREEKVCDAILLPWQYGIEGEGVTDVMFGDFNPEAKLCASFPYDIGQIPIYYGKVTTGRPYYGEKVEMSKTVSSYQTNWTCHYMDMPSDPLYCFGHGLSYTTFKIDNPKSQKDKYKIGEDVVICVNVSNTGKKKGTLTLQTYIHDVASEVSRPVKELKDFVKVELNPGESKEVQITLKPDSFEYYHFDKTLYTDPGEFKIWVSEDCMHGEPITITLE